MLFPACHDHGLGRFTSLGDDHVDDDLGENHRKEQAVNGAVCITTRHQSRISITCKFQDQVTKVIVTLRPSEFGRIGRSGGGKIKYIMILVASASQILLCNPGGLVRANWFRLSAHLPQTSRLDLLTTFQTYLQPPPFLPVPVHTVRLISLLCTLFED